MSTPLLSAHKVRRFWRILREKKTTKKATWSEHMLSKRLFFYKRSFRPKCPEYTYTRRLQVHPSIHDWILGWIFVWSKGNCFFWSTYVTYLSKYSTKPNWLHDYRDNSLEVCVLTFFFYDMRIIFPNQQKKNHKKSVENWLRKFEVRFKLVNRLFSQIFFRMVERNSLPYQNGLNNHHFIVKASIKYKNVFFFYD